MKNAKICEELHKRLRIFAAQHGMPIGLVIDAACVIGLQNPDQIRQLVEDHTNQEQRKAVDELSLPES